MNLDIELVKICIDCGREVKNDNYRVVQDGKECFICEDCFAERFKNKIKNLKPYEHNS